MGTPDTMIWASRRMHTQRSTEYDRPRAFQLVVFVFTCIVVPLSADAQERDVVPPSGTITIGAALSLTGRYKEEGLHTYNGYEIATNRINQLGGIKVGNKRYRLDIVYEDDQSESKRSATLVERSGRLL